MDALDFVTAVLPSEGKYCVAVIDPTMKRQSFHNDLQDFITDIYLHDTQGRTAYMAMASFGDDPNRQAHNAQCLRSIFVDIDCATDPAKDPTKVYANKKEGLTALDRFLQVTGLRTLGDPWLLDSGGGIHVHFPLDTDEPVAAWKPVAEAFKRAAKAHGLKIDFTVTADAARVLRLPGTHNFKYTPPREVQLKRHGAIFKLDDIERVLRPYHTTPIPAAMVSSVVPGAPLKAPVKPVMAAMLANSVTYFKDILARTRDGTGCAQIADYITRATDEGMEPMWRGMLSLTKVCTDGFKASERMSALHPYDKTRMLAKLAEIKGPYPCSKLDSENPGLCGDCPHWGKITNPLALGRATAVVTQESVVDAGETLVKRPAPPRGFSFGRAGGVYAQTREVVDGDTVTKEVMILPFDFFLVDTHNDCGVHNARFMLVRNGVQSFVTVPHEKISSKDSLLACLSGQNVIASFGSGNDKNMYEYVRCAVAEASSVGEALVVPPNYGWQEHGGFAVGDTVYLKNRKEYQFVSKRLSNLISVTRPKGTVENWASVMQMMMKKGLWGHITHMGIGFASPLMAFAPAGSRAMTFHIASDKSSTGKTLALAAANSIWGEPFEYAVKPKTSENTLLQRAGLLGGLHLAVDEITNKQRSDSEWAPRHIFDFSQGGHKLKGSNASNAEIADDLRWASLCFITSNTPLLEAMMGARDVTSSGEAMRLLEWRGSGIELEWTPSEREVLKLLNDNYGVAGRVYAKYIANHPELAQRVMQDAMELWRKEAGAVDKERFWTSGCGAIIAGFILAGRDHANIVTIPIAPVLSFLKRLVQDARRIINTNQLYAFDILNSYIRDHNGNFVKIAATNQSIAVFMNDREVSKDTTKGAIRGRVEYDATPGYNDTFIEIRMLKVYCAQRNRSYIEFLRDLEHQYPVKEVRKNLTSKTKMTPLIVQCLCITQPNEIPADEDFLI